MLDQADWTVREQAHRRRAESFLRARPTAGAPAGRAEYVRSQQEIAARAAPLRAALAGRCDALLTAVAAGAADPAACTDQRLLPLGKLDRR